MIEAARPGENGLLGSLVVEDFLVGAFKNLLSPVRGIRGPSGTDANSVNRFLASRASVYDPTSNSIDRRNRFTDKINDIDNNSRRAPNVVSRLLSFFDNVDF